MPERIVKDDVLSSDYVNEMEERRLKELDRAGIDEGEVLDQAHKHLNDWNAYFSENITRGKADEKFTIRDQWSSLERSEFTRLFKVAMTFNKIYDNVKKVAGEQRKNKPDLMVRSLTGRASQEQINLRADLLRTIAYQSQNDLVYQTAFRSALVKGYGAFQVSLDYRPHSFFKDIRYDIITDADTCFFDPKAIKPHKGDGNFCARLYMYSKDEFYSTYPYISNPVSYVDPYMLAEFEWTNKDTIMVCDYFVKEWFPLKLFKLSNGQTVSEQEWEKMQKNFKEQLELTEGSIVQDIVNKSIPKIVAERQDQDYVIMHYRLIKNQIIEFSEWPSKHLPIIFVDGDSYYIDGRQYIKSFVHEAKDAQKCVNYLGSEIISEVKNRRREQWLATPDNIIGNEQQWRNPELQMGALIAKPDPKTGQMPIKLDAWDISPSLMQNFQRATQDIREIMGFSEQESLQGKDISGKARRERKLEGSMASYVFSDNLNQAIEQSGRVVNDLLNQLVDDEEERHFIISKKDGESQSIILNQLMQDGSRANVLDKGEYDIEISTGPSFAVQKDIALEFLQQTLQAYPGAFPLVADLYAKNLDVQFMPQMAERFKTLVPPQILAKESGEPMPPQPPSPQEQMMQMEMQSKQQEIMERAKNLQLKEQQQEIEKLRLMMDAKELSAKLKNDHRDQDIELKKADMDYSAKIAKIWADLHDTHNKPAKST